MATKRVAKTSVEWAKLQKLLPQDQQSIYTSLLGKNYQYLLKIASLPENLPKIDFDSYKKQLVNAALIEKLEKGYLAFQVPVPKDTENFLGKVDQLEKEEDSKLVELLKEVSKKIDVLQAERAKLTNLPPLEEMNLELYSYYFPDKAKPNDYWKHYGDDEKYGIKLKGT